MAQMRGPIPILRKGRLVPATVAFDVELDELEFLAGLGFVVSSVEETKAEDEKVDETKVESETEESKVEPEKVEPSTAKEAVSKEKPASALSKASKA